VRVASAVVTFSCRSGRASASSASFAAFCAAKVWSASGVVKSASLAMKPLAHREAASSPPEAGCAWRCITSGSTLNGLRLPFVAVSIMFFAPSMWLMWLIRMPPISIPPI
jgi:hypothetical protein